MLKFSKGQDNLDKLLGTQRISFNKEDIGYNPLIKKKTYEDFFVQSTSQNKSHLTCNYCLKNGHISYSCYLRKSCTSSMGTKRCETSKCELREKRFLSTNYVLRAINFYREIQGLKA